MCTYDLSGSSQSTTPEQVIADIISKEARVYINPHVLRLIVKYNWAELSKAAHQIHDAG